MAAEELRVSRAAEANQVAVEAKVKMMKAVRAAARTGAPLTRGGPQDVGAQRGGGAVDLRAFIEELLGPEI